MFTFYVDFWGLRCIYWHVKSYFTNVAMYCVEFLVKLK